MPTMYARQVEDDDDELLLKNGWVFAGVSLFHHPVFETYKYHTKIRAMQQQADWYVLDMEAADQEIRDILHNH